MSDISNQLIKDSYNYVLQSDLSTGIVYRIGGGIPVNPKFLSGLTINTNFNYSNGTEQPGFVLITDASGNASWGPVSGSSSGNYLSLSGGTVTGPTIFTGGLTANTISATTYFNLPVSGVTGGTGISASSSNGLVTIVNTLPDQVVTITGGTNININGTYPNFGINFTGSTGVSGDFLPLSGGTVTGGTIFTSGVTANTISATTYQNLPATPFLPLSGGTVTGATIFTGGLNGNTITSDGGFFTTWGLGSFVASPSSFSYQKSQVVDDEDKIVTLNADVESGFGVGYINNTNPGSASMNVKNNVDFTVNTTIDSVLVNNTVTISPTQTEITKKVITYGGFEGPYLIANSITGTTISATTYLNLPSSGGSFTGGTVSGATTFKNGLTANTISATTYQNLPATPFLPLSGGTVTGATSFTGGLTANTISATTYQNLPATPFLPLSGGTVTGNTTFTAGLTGSTIVANSLEYTWIGLAVGRIFSYFNDTIYSNETGKTHYFGGGPLNVQNNLSVPNGSLQVGGNVLISSGLTANTISATTYQNLPTDIRVTGGTYSGSTIIFTNNTGGTFNVTGFYTGGTDVFVTGATKSGNVATFTNNTGGTFTLTGLTDTFVTGGTYDTGSSSITFTNNSGGTFNVTGITSSGGGSFTGGTVSGATEFTGGLTANTISATTITSPSISPYGLIVATSIGYQNIF